MLLPVQNVAYIHSMLPSRFLPALKAKALSWQPCGLGFVELALAAFVPARVHILLSGGARCAIQAALLFSMIAPYHCWKDLLAPTAREPPFAVFPRLLLQLFLASFAHHSSRRHCDHDRVEPCNLLNGLAIGAA